MRPFTVLLNDALAALRIDAYALSCAFIFLVGQLFVLVPVLGSWTAIPTGADWVVITCVMIADRGVFGSVVKFGLLRIMGTLLGVGISVALILGLWHTPPVGCIGCEWKPYVYAVVFAFLSYGCVFLKTRHVDYDYCFLYVLLTVCIVGNTAYLELVHDSGEQVNLVMFYAVGRSIGILIGVGICVVFGLLLSPKARHKFSSGMAAVLESLAGTAELTIGGTVLEDFAARNPPPRRAALSARGRPLLDKARNTLESLRTLVEGSFAFELTPARPHRVDKRPALEVLRGARLAYGCLAGMYFGKLSALAFLDLEGAASIPVGAAEAAGKVGSEDAAAPPADPDSKEQSDADGDATPMDALPPGPTDPDKATAPPPDNPPSAPSADDGHLLALGIPASLSSLPTQRAAIERAMLASCSELRRLSGKFALQARGEPAESAAPDPDPLAGALASLAAGMAGIRSGMRGAGDGEALGMFAVWAEMERTRTVVLAVAELRDRCDRVLAGA